MVTGVVDLLNWNSEKCRWSLEEGEASSGKTRRILRLSLHEVYWTDFMRASTAGVESEIKVSIDEKLVLFFRKNQNPRESKLLIAHPEKERWVVTCLFSETALRMLAENEKGREIKFHQLGDLHFLSNLEMVWTSMG